MDSKGSILIYGLMLSLVIIVIALALSPAVSESVNDARSESVGDVLGMNCSTTSDNFIKSACVATDLSLFYFISGLIFIAGGILTAKVVFS